MKNGATDKLCEWRSHEDQLCVKMNGTAKQDLEVPYATRSLVREMQRNNYNMHETHQSLYAEPNIQPTAWKPETHQILKDSGYYSCEFLDRSSRVLKKSKNRPKQKNGAVRQGSRSSHYRPQEGETGVFTLSHVYMRPNQPDANFSHEGIYDNII